MPALTTLVDGTVPVAADFNGNYVALNRVCGVSTAITSYALGDTIYASATDTLSKLAIGGVGQSKIIAATGLPSWGNAAPAELAGLGMANDSSSPNTVLDIGPGGASSDDSSPASRALMVNASTMTKSTSAWVVGSGNGGLATGVAVANNTWYHVFIIMRPDTGVVDFAFDTSAVGANIAANTNAAYTKKRRIGSFKTATGTTNILAFIQDGDYFRWAASILDFDNTNPGNAAVTRTLTVPTGVNVLAFGNLELFDTVAGALAHLSDLAVNDEAPVVTAAAPLGQIVVSGAGLASQGQFQIRTNTSAQIRSRCGTTTANTIIRGATMGWFDRRGRG